MTDADQELVVDELLRRLRGDLACAASPACSTAGRPGAERELLRRMGDAIAHRGPDGEGQYADGPVGLANRRLAIIDRTPAGAHADGTRRRPLLDHLQRRGLQLPRAARRARGRRAPRSARTPTPRSCSTPTREWGAACVERFNGMFAFAIWDRERPRAVPRPRPLRHQAALLRGVAGDVPVRLGDQGVARARRAVARGSASPHLLEYFTFQNIFTDGTLFDGVRLLPAGHHLTRARRRRPRAAARSTGTSTSPSPTTADALRRGVRGGARPAVPPGGRAPARQRRAGRRAPQRRHGLRLASPRSRPRRCPYLTTFTVGFDMTSRVGLELGADERVKAEAM